TERTDQILALLVGHGVVTLTRPPEEELPTPTPRHILLHSAFEARSWLLWYLLAEMWSEDVFSWWAPLVAGARLRTDAVNPGNGTCGFALGPEEYNESNELVLEVYPALTEVRDNWEREKAAIEGIPEGEVFRR